VRQIAQSYKTGKLTLADVSNPAAPSGGILVQTTASLISAGTERMLVDLARKSLVSKARERPDLVAKVLDKVKREGALAAFDAVRSKLDTPIPLGYSMAGRVIEAGSDAREFAVGDRVACAGAGIANHAELNAVPRNLAVQIPDGVTDEEACFATVAAIGLQGVRLVKPALGELAVVIGLGLIGQITVSLLIAHGCDVVGIDVDPARVKLAMERGAVAGVVAGKDDPVAVVRGISRDRGADHVVITASSLTNEPLVVAGDVARERAIISVVGFMPLEIPRAAYYAKELEVVVSRSYGPGRYDTDYEERGHDYPIGYVRWTMRRNLEAILGAIASKRLDVKSLITHRFPFERSLDAYNLITAEHPEPHLGVVLTYPDREISRSTPKPAATPARARSGELGLAVIGTGSFATSVLLPAIKELEGVRLIATASGRGLSARHAADRFGAEVTAEGLSQVLERSDVEAIVIATRHDRHASQAVRALQAGRDVFVEKPAAITDDQLRELGEAVHQSGRRLMVGFNRRFAPFAVSAREFLSSRSSGLVMTCRINAGKIPAGSWITDRSEGGGRIIGEACHFVDLMSYWAGSAPVKVSAHAIGPAGGYSRDDNLVVGLTFADGSVGTLVYTAMGDPSVGKETYELFSDGRVVQLEDWRTLRMTSKGKTTTKRALRANKGHKEELVAFAQACRSGAASPISWESIEATTRTTFAIEQAWGAGATVEL